MEPGFTIYLNDTSSLPLKNALNILQRDISNTLGTKARIEPIPRNLDTIQNALIILNENTNHTYPVDKLDGFERHKLFVKNNNLILQGSDLRGTLYAIFTFSEKFLKIQPLWFWASHNKPEKQKMIRIPADFTFDSGEPYVKYRAWFPNDTDMFAPWKKQSPLHNKVWLETMLRLKMNTVEIESAGDYSKHDAISDDARLIHEHGLLITFHHQSALDSKFNKWDKYWQSIREMEPPALLLENKDKFEEFWRYNVQCLVKNGISPIWGVNFRGNRDIPFWYTFPDAPSGMQDRADIISQMVQKQMKILKEETGEENPLVRWIFYDELSDFLSENMLNLPAGKNLIWNFVAARRDHFPNDDIRSIPVPDSVKLGYYLNLQFTSTGSHLVQAEGPWKMEKNFRFVDLKNNQPLFFSVVNAGNLREHLLSLTANAKLLWNFDTYNSDLFLKEFCSQYYGDEHADIIAQLYKDYFYAFWNQKKSELPEFDRQYIFHDLRYKQAVKQISEKFFEPVDLNPLEDFSWEQLPDRTFRIVPEDNGTTNQIEAIIKGTENSYKKFLKVSQTADSLYPLLEPEPRVFFNDNLRLPAHFMMYLNESLNKYCQAYISHSDINNHEYDQQVLLKQALQAAINVRQTLYQSAHGPFKTWYAEESIFDLDDYVDRINKTLKMALTH